MGAGCRRNDQGEFFFLSHAQSPLFLMVDLRKDRELVARLWNGSQSSRVALSVAAAITFHQTRRGDDVPQSWNEYARALDIAAAALSRLVTIYTVNEQGQPVPAAIDVARERFRGGASEVLRGDGTVLAPLDIVRGDLPPALQQMGHTRIEYLAPRNA
jgi:hypothetical protein